MTVIKPTIVTEMKKDNLLYNLLFNIVIPTVILMKLSSENMLGPVLGLILAVLFPLGYGAYDLYQTKKVNFISVLGLVSVLLTGVFGLMELSPEWIAWKEASIPLLIAIAIPISTKTKYHLFKTLIYNDAMWDKEKIDRKLAETEQVTAMDKRLNNATYMLSLSFILSSVLNYGLAKYLLVSAPGTEAYNEELGRMTSLSFPVIAVPSMIVMVIVLLYFVKGLEKYTGYKLEEVIKS